MKSIANQYRDLKEGKMTQSNFMRNLRMSMPQYITNVTSFKDAVRILKNKAILSEAEINELSPQTKYNAAMKAVDKSYMSDNPSDIDRKKIVRQGKKFIEEIDPVLKKTVIDFGKSLGFETKIEKGGTGNQLEPIVQILMGKDLRNPEIRVVIKKGTDKVEGGQYLPDEAAERRLGNLIKQIQKKELDVELKETLNENRAFEVAKKLKEEGMDEDSIHVYLVDNMGLSNMAADSIINDLFNEVSESVAEERLESFYEIVGEQLEEIAREKYKLSEDEIEQMFESEWHSGKNDKIIEKWYRDQEEPSVVAERIIEDYLNVNEGDEEDEMDDLIKKIGQEEEEEKAIKGGFGIYDPLEEGKKKAEPKAKLHPNQIHPGELRMGIRVEMEHTDDPKKAEKIALDHLAENPFYYTALKLAGVESPSAPKVKAPAEKKAKKKKEAVELVDKANAMQKVKMPKKVVNEVRINAMPGEETNATMKQAMQYIDSDIANPTLKAISDKLELQPLRDNRAILRYGYWEKMPDEALAAVKKQFNVEEDIDTEEEKADSYIYIISSKNKAGNLGSSLEMGASKASQMDAFKEALEKLVREALAETFDGRDNLANITDDTK